jgi:hypothetical protein
VADPARSLAFPVRVDAGRYREALERLYEWAATPAVVELSDRSGVWLRPRTLREVKAAALAASYGAQNVAACGVLADIIGEAGPWLG